jgi:hypothetical protein
VFPPLAKGGFLKIKNGYFYDTEIQEYWFAYGIAYQTWIIQLGEWQTKEQIDYDLREMRKMGANSIRVDFVWQSIEVADDVFDWRQTDYLVGKFFFNYDRNNNIIDITIVFCFHFKFLTIN